MENLGTKSQARAYGQDSPWLAGCETTIITITQPIQVDRPEETPLEVVAQKLKEQEGPMIRVRAVIFQPIIDLSIRAAVFFMRDS